MSDITLNLTPRLYNYLQENSLREVEVLKKLREETHKMPSANMQISPEQGQLMGLLIELLDAKKTLDIGTFTGYSALVVALSLPSNGKVITCDISERDTILAKRFWQMAGMEDKIDLRIAPAIDTLESLLKEDQESTFDFSFIDADKLNYDAYYEKSLLLLRRGGLVAIDNTLWGGKVADPSINDKKTIAIRELNQKSHIGYRGSFFWTKERKEKNRLNQELKNIKKGNGYFMQYPPRYSLFAVTPSAPPYEYSYEGSSQKYQKK